VLAFVALGAGCSSQRAPVGGGPPPPSAQELFKVHLIADVSSLDSGILGYQAPATTQTGAEAKLVVEVTDIGTGPAGTAPPPSGFVYARQDVPTGGIVGVRASCQDLTCDPSSPERQPVLTPGTTGDWSWNLSANSPGTAHILLVATAYDQNTDIALHVTRPIDIAVAVTAAPGYWLSEAGRRTEAVLKFVGFGAIASAVLWLYRRRQKDSEPAAPDEPTDPGKSGRR
jgi:hypothetical protein